MVKPRSSIAVYESSSGTVFGGLPFFHVSLSLIWSISHSIILSNSSEVHNIKLVVTLYKQAVPA